MSVKPANKRSREWFVRRHAKKEPKCVSEYVETEFRALVDQWNAEAPPSSRIEDLILHPDYQRIIGMGPAVVPLLLREMVRKPDHWSWALRAITGANPIKPEHRGDLELIAQDWIE